MLQNTYFSEKDMFAQETFFVSWKYFGQEKRCWKKSGVLEKIKFWKTWKKTFKKVRETLENLGKMERGTGKSGKSQGILVFVVVLFLSWKVMSDIFLLFLKSN